MGKKLLLHLEEREEEGSAEGGKGRVRLMGKKTGSKGGFGSRVTWSSSRGERQSRKRGAARIWPAWTKKKKVKTQERRQKQNARNPRHGETDAKGGIKNHKGKRLMVSAGSFCAKRTGEETQDHLARGDTVQQRRKSPLRQKKFATARKWPGKKMHSVKGRKSGAFQMKKKEKGKSPGRDVFDERGNRKARPGRDLMFQKRIRQIESGIENKLRP